jgi:hypothetical protein
MWLIGALVALIVATPSPLIPVRRRQIDHDGQRVWMLRAKHPLTSPNPFTLTSVANLASTYRNKERWKEAEELFVPVMETRKRVLGEESQLGDMFSEPESEGEDQNGFDGSEHDLGDTEGTTEERRRTCVVNGESGRTVAACIEEHMLKETVCGRCSTGESWKRLIQAEASTGLTINCVLRSVLIETLAFSTYGITSDYIPITIVI